MTTATASKASGVQPLKKATPAVFFQHVAAHILQLNAHQLPDLRDTVVLLPNHHVAKPLTDALNRASGGKALQLPKMVTLNDWAQSVNLSSPVTPDVCRATTLYHALRARSWFADANLWAISNELIGLLDEMTRHHVTLPRDEKDFLNQLEAAYQAKNNASMQFEARVVHELWYAMGATGELDAARAHQERLAVLAQEADHPLVVLLASELDAQEARFINAYEKRAPVKVFSLRDMMAREPAYAVLSALPSLWRKNTGAMSLREQATSLRDHTPQAALGQRLRLFGANSLEQEARAAEVQVRQWLAEGKQNIAIVAQDRHAARRVRALLERTGVQVEDEGGWKFSTLVVSTVLMRWLDALQSDFYYQDLLDLLKSPYLFADAASQGSKRAVFTLEQLVRKHGVSSHLDSFYELAKKEKEVLDVLDHLKLAAKLMQKNSDTLGGWLQSLEESLLLLGITGALEADKAGLQLLENIQTWQGELAGDTARFTRTEWRHWLAQMLDDNTFSDPDVNSPVHLTHLAATRWRSFDAVLLLGCDSNHLPSIDKDSVLFNDAVRGTLGLPTRDIYQARQRDTLLSLLAMNDTVLATWQASKGGEKAMLSPYLEILRTVHNLAYGENLADRTLAALLKNAPARAADPTMPTVATIPKPVAPKSMVPYYVSASGYNSLVDCPYQYFARHILRLNEMDEVSEEVEKRDYGQWVHEILHRFHERFPVMTGLSRLDLEVALQILSEEVFAPMVKRDYLARAWLARWVESIPSYLDTQLKNEADGWLYQDGEVPFEVTLAGGLTLHGRIDRRDRHPVTHAVRVLDYKTMDAGRLRGKLKEAGEDVQLPFYASVSKAADAAFVSIDKSKVVNVVPPQDLPELANANMVRLELVFNQMRTGAALPANGVDDACGYCEMRGLCRKSEWRNIALGNGAPK